MFTNYIRLNELKKTQAKIKELQVKRSEYAGIPSMYGYAAKGARVRNADALEDTVYYLSSLLTGRCSYEELTDKLTYCKINPDKLTELGHYLINYGENQKYVNLIDEEIEKLRFREENLKEALGIKQGGN